jgi:hypothetical protein
MVQSAVTVTSEKNCSSVRRRRSIRRSPQLKAPQLQRKTKPFRMSGLPKKISVATGR